MADIILNPNEDILPQIQYLYDYDVDGDDEVEITDIVDFHALLADVEEDYDLTIEDAIHNALIGYGAPYDPQFAYKRVVSDTELEITYTTRFEGLAYVVENGLV